MQKKQLVKDKLPAVRCDKGYKKKVMEHAIVKSGSYAQYISTLIEADLKLSENIKFERPKGKHVYEEVSVSIPSDLKEHLEYVRSKTNISMSEQIRKDLMKAKGVRELEMDEIVTLMQTNNLLIALGRNLNQLTRRANANMAVEIPRELISSLIDVVDKTRDDITELMNKLGL